MNRNFEMPKLTIQKFEVEDIMTTSGGGDPDYGGTGGGPLD